MTITLPLLNLDVLITPWKIWGFTGALMFTGRWFVQMHYSRKAGRPVIPLVYWFMSLIGSFMLLLYFIFGKNDSVGIVNSLFPSFVSTYNLFLELAHRKRNRFSNVEVSGE